MLNSLEKIVLDKKNTLTVTVHRTENIYDKKQLKKFVDLLISISDLNLFESINWYCHDITKSAIEKYNYEKKFFENKINLNALIPHNEFNKGINKFKMCNNRWRFDCRRMFNNEPKYNYMERRY